MRLANGIKVDKEKTFGKLRFSGMRREVQRRNDDGTLGEVQRRTYDLKSGVQGQMIQVSISADIPVKNYEYNGTVELVNPIVDTVAEVTYSGADVNWYIRADDIIPCDPARGFQKPDTPKKEEVKPAAQQK